MTTRRPRITVRFDGKRYVPPQDIQEPVEDSPFLDRKPIHGRHLYVACDLFLTAKMPYNEPLTGRTARFMKKLKILNHNSDDSKNVEDYPHR